MASHYRQEMRLSLLYKPSDNPSPTQKATSRLEGKARKLAGNADAKAQAAPQTSLDPGSISKILPLKDYIPLAEHIAASSTPPAILPRSILHKLEQAIALRRRCASWFKITADAATSPATNESHCYFIEVLETTSGLLKPLCAKATSVARRTHTVSNTSESKEDTDAEAKLQSRFEMLTVEHLEEGKEDLGTNYQKKKAGKSPAPKRTTFVPEQQSQTDDFLLGSFCFFQDLQDVRSFLQDIWQRYKQRQVALMTASLVTNTALDFVRRAEQNFMTTFAQSGDYYDCFVDQMFRHACKIRGYPFAVKKDPMQSPQTCWNGCFGLCAFDNNEDKLAVDAFRSGLREMARAKVVPAWLVFATQNHLDIQHILREGTGRGWEELRTTRAVIYCRVQRHIDIIAPLVSLHSAEREEHQWLESNSRLFLSNTFEGSLDLFYFYPLGAGLRQFLTVAWFRQAAVERAANRDIVGMAHLYHAAQLQSQCAAWPDMESIVDTQTSDHIFLGGRPVSVEQCCLKAELALGRSIKDTDLRISAPENPIMVLASRFRLLQSNDIPFAIILCTRCIASDSRAVDRAAENLELVLNAALHGIDRSKFRQDMHGVLLQRPELLKLTSRKGTATMCELLAALEQNLNHEAPALHFDYWAFRIACSRLFKPLIGQVSSTWLRVTGMHLRQQDDPISRAVIPQKILMMAKESQAAERAAADVAGVADFGARLLNELTDILEAFIKTDGSAAVSGLREFAESPPDDLLWAGYQARFGNDLPALSPSSSHQEGQEEASSSQSPSPRPTLSSLTEEEAKLMRQLGISLISRPLKLTRRGRGPGRCERR